MNIELDDLDPGPLVANHEQVESLQRAVINAPRDVNILRMAMANTLKLQAWTDRLDVNRGRRFRYSPDAFLKFITDPLPDGLESSVETLRRFLGDGPERAAFELAVARGPGGNNNPEGKNQHTEEQAVNVSNGNIDRDRESPVGNTIGYAVRRLARERPDLLDKVQAGELSANRAMVEAGFRKVKTPLEQAKRAYLLLTPAERQQLQEWQLQQEQD